MSVHQGGYIHANKLLACTNCIAHLLGTFVPWQKLLFFNVRMNNAFAFFLCGSESNPLAVHLGNDNAMRKLVRDGVGIKDIQKTYLSLCYVSSCYLHLLVTSCCWRVLKAPPGQYCRKNFKVNTTPTTPRPILFCKNATFLSFFFGRIVSFARATLVSK